VELQHIPLSNLKVASLNVRHGGRKPDVADLVPSIRTRGILQPLLVRHNGEGFEVVAGRRRFFAVQHIVEEDGAPAEEALVPCAVMHDGDNAAAIEASLIENVTHLPMDEMDQYEAFARLARQGRSVAEIADTFGVPELTVKRRLALGTLSPKVRDAYRAELIDGETLKLLTLASKAQQKEWLALFDEEQTGDGGRHAPRGWQLKSWLFGGERIATKAALFALDRYPGAVVTDLFGEESYFADRDAFWTLQNEAIAELRDSLLTKGWTDVVVLARGERFQLWDHVQVSRKKGGKVFIQVRESGEVEVHEGYLGRREASARLRAERKGAEAEPDGAMERGARPELSKAAVNYVALHRHAIIRAALLKQPGIALRLAGAHIIAGSSLWTINAESQTAERPEIAESVRTSAAQAAFEAERAAILDMLQLNLDYRGTVVRGNGDAQVAAAIFARLLALSDKEVRRVLAFVIGETLAAGSVLCEAAGAVMKPNVAIWWQPDDLFLDLVKDRRVVNAMLAEVAGETVANGNVAETAKVQKKIIRDCLMGTGREKVEGWLPGYMEFPIRQYRDDASFELAERWQGVATLFVASE
jgi:ParB family chromosome partitioning protein